MGLFHLQRRSDCIEACLHDLAEVEEIVIGRDSSSTRQTENTGLASALPAPIRLTAVIVTEFIHSVVVAEVAVVAIFPNVARVGVEERVVTAAIRELDSAEASFGLDALGLKDWFQ
jgi:hypothetical protein